MYQTIDVGE